MTNQGGSLSRSRTVLLLDRVNAAFDSQWFRRTEGGVTLITQPMIDNYLASK